MKAMFTSQSGRLILCLVLILTVHSPGSEGAKWSNIMSSLMSGRERERMHVESIEGCIVACLRRLGCKYAAAYLGGPYIGSACELDMTPSNHSEMSEVKLCYEYGLHRHHMPKKMAGACEEHTCSVGMMCVGVTGGGHTCVKAPSLEAKYSHRKKTKKHNSTRMSPNSKNTTEPALP